MLASSWREIAQERKQNGKVYVFRSRIPIPRHIKSSFVDYVHKFLLKNKMQFVGVERKKSCAPGFSRTSDQRTRLYRVCLLPTDKSP
jgi:hypothetical protein